MEEYTPDIVSIVDEEGKEHVFEELDRVETDKGRYVALLPLPENPDKITEEESELIILKVEEDDGEIYLCPIEDDNEFEEVGTIFEERLSELYDFEGNDEE
ncbi:MAG: DUF1292 domain-containing protein [Clostridia bacterium]|nr:DUF1292 domain-containing protein [Clostridia bacterium]